MTGFSTPKAVDIVRKLRALGAVLLPDEKPEAVAARHRAGAGAPTAAEPGKEPRSPAGGGRAGERRIDDEDRPTIRAAAGTIISAEDAAAMAEDVEIAVAERDRILTMHRRIRGGDPVAILGVADAADKKAIKRAYFALSKEFHPDRYYGKRTGSFAARLTELFEAISSAYAELSGDRPRRAGSTGGWAAAAPAASAQSPVDHAAELFDRACQCEVSGDLPRALSLFSQALRLDAPARYLRRAARCALAAREFSLGLEYAKKAASLDSNDPSTARLLAQAFKAVGKLEDAEEVLVLALMIKTENDQLAHELQADLAEVRRLTNR
jgi:tetratricopeptide (TPR) repeat protein